LLGTAARLSTVHIIVIISFTLTYMPCYLTNFNGKTVSVLMCIRITNVYNRSKVKDYIQKKLTLAFPYGTKLICIKCGSFSKVGSNCFVKKLLESGQRAS